MNKLSKLNKLLHLPFRLCYELPPDRKARGGGNGGSKKSKWQRSRLYAHVVRKRPWYIALGLPLLLVWAVWFPCIGGLHLWGLFTSRYALVFAMFIASILAGFTSQGTGGLSFPVMTLLFGIAPLEARDFAFLAQAVVMSGASFAIIYQNLPLETNAILFSSFGGAFGTMFALQWIAPFVPDTEAIMNFVSLWIGFGAAVFWLSRERDKETQHDIPNCSNWKAFVLIVTGFCGGMFSAMFGSGLDLSVFCCLTLLFRINVNTAAPTGVVIQMINSVSAVGFKLLFMSGFDRATFLHWVASLPLIALGAPLGTICLSFVNRTFVSVIIYLIHLSQFIYAIFVLPINTDMIFFTVVIVIVSSGLFLLLAKLGEKLIDVENKGYIYDSDDDDSYDEIEDGTVSFESLPPMEELREGKKNMERRENGSEDTDERDDLESDDDEDNQATTGWSPYGRRRSSVPNRLIATAETAYLLVTNPAAPQQHDVGRRQV